MSRRQTLLLAGLAGLGLVGCDSKTRSVATATSRSATPTRSEVSMQTIRYGSDSSQFAELHLPASTAASMPVVVVVHGGYWGSGYGLSLGTPLAKDLAQQGVAAWNIEYRRLGNGGGWPATFQDVAAAMDALTDKGNTAAGGRLDLSRVVVVGHSAGGQIAGWLAGRHKLAPGAVGAGPVVSPIGYVAQAGVLDLVAGFRDNLGGGAVGAVMGGSPEQFPDRYAVGSPYVLLPLGVPGTLVHGIADPVVPISQSDNFAAQASKVGDRVSEVRVPGIGHFELIDPKTSAWAQCRQAALGYVRS